MGISRIIKVDSSAEHRPISSLALQIFGLLQGYKRVIIPSGPEMVMSIFDRGRRSSQSGKGMTDSFYIS